MTDTNTVVTNPVKVDNDYNPEYMELACQISYDNIDKGGGPFGAVIVKDDMIVSTGANSVTLLNDPTAHAEVLAIRHACAKLKNFKLDGCIVYSSCEPCPMCLSALYWAGVKKIYYGNTKEDAASIDFSDRFIYEELERKQKYRKLPAIHIDGTTAIKAFQKWAASTEKIPY